MTDNTAYDVVRMRMERAARRAALLGPLERELARAPRRPRTGLRRLLGGLTGVPLEPQACC